MFSIFGVSTRLLRKFRPGRSVQQSATNPYRFRPRLEGFEDRLVPDAYTWVGTDTSNNPLDPNNWSPHQVPTDTDDLYFDGTASNEDFYSVSTQNRFQSVHLVNGYSGSVTFSGGLTVADLELRSGNLSQPATSQTTTDLVYESFTWTGGVLNDTTNSADLEIYPGATATIDPGEGNTLITGMFLTFEIDQDDTGIPGAQGTFNSGTVQFNNNAGVIIGGAFASLNMATVTMNPGVTFQTAGLGIISVNAGGQCLINGPGIYQSALPIQVMGGILKIEGSATASFTGQLPGGRQPSVYMDTTQSSRIYIRDGSSLAATFGVRLDGGKLSTLPGAAGASQTATIETSLVNNNGADVVINDDDFDPPGGSHTPGILKCTGEVRWNGGTFRPVINSGNRTCDLWETDEDFVVGGTAGLAPGTINGVAPAGTTFLFLKADPNDGGITGAAPPVNSPTVTYTVITDAGNPVSEWYFRKS